MSHYPLPLAETIPLFAPLLALPLPEDTYPPLNLSPQRQRQKTLESLVAMLLELAAREPVLFILEDLQWTDPTTLEFLDLLVEHVPASAICMLLTCRPEFQSSWHYRSYLTEITVNRLSEGQIAQMAQHVAGDKALPGDIIPQLVDKTDGVPLYVEEMTKALLESGYLKDIEGRYELTGTRPALAIPATLQDSLMARLDRLATAKGIAQLGAVVGRQFSYELLQAVAQLDETTLQRELGRLVEAELVYQRGFSPQATYVFKHALLQEAAYQSLLRSTRQQYHQHIAQVLAAQFPDLVETQPELLAHHYTEAGLADAAVGYWQRAGQKASERAACVEAISHFTTGLEVLRTLPDTPARTQYELDLLLLLGPAVHLARGQASPEYEHVYVQAHALCQRLGDTPHLFSVLTGLRQMYNARGEFQTARQYGEQALALALDLQDPALLGTAHYSLGVALLNLGEVTSAHAHFAQGITHADAARDSWWGALSRLFAAKTLWCLGYPDQALERTHEALALVQSLHPYSEFFALQEAGLVHEFRREVPEAHARSEAALALATEHGFVEWLPNIMNQYGGTLAMLGHYEAGIAQMRQGIATPQATQTRKERLPKLLSRLAAAYGNSGQAEVGLGVLAEALAMVDTTGDGLHHAELHRLKGELLLRQGVPDTFQAEACFHQAIAISQSQQAKSWELRAATSLTTLWQRQGKRQEAYDLLAPVYNWFTEGFDTADLKDAKALLDELSESR